MTTPALADRLLGGLDGDLEAVVLYLLERLRDRRADELRHLLRLVVGRAARRQERHHGREQCTRQHAGASALNDPMHRTPLPQSPPMARSVALSTGPRRAHHLTRVKAACEDVGVQRALAVIGAPSSAGAYAPGQEQAPAALRAAGLVACCATAGRGGRRAATSTAFRWAPDRALAARAERARGRARPSRAVADARRAPRWRTAPPARAGRRLHGRRRHGPRPRRAQRAARARLPRPARRHEHAAQRRRRRARLDGPRAHARPARHGRRARALGGDAAARARRVVLLGPASGAPRSTSARAVAALGMAAVGDEELARDPARRRGAGARARCRRLRPARRTSTSTWSTSPTRRSPRTPGATSACRWRARSRRCACWPPTPRVDAITLTELNPLHGAEDGSTLRRFAGGFARALAGA